MLSRGTCYAPPCKEPVLKMAESGTPRVNVQIAHIRALVEGEARYDKNYPEKLRNRFENLILLCKPHHTEVDSDLWVEQYPAEVLLRWKAEVEGGGLGDALKNVPPLNGDKEFEGIIVKSVETARLEILGRSTN